MANSQPRHSFEWQDVGGIAVVHFTTPILRDEQVIRGIFDALEVLIANGQTQMVINFGGLEAFASYAIGKLIRLNDRLQPPTGRLALCNLAPLVAEIIDIMNLRKKFRIYPTEQSAIESLR